MVSQETQPLLVAVSGGIDSVVLLDVLVRQQTKVVVAHVNHGIRPNSDEDEHLVRQLAEQYKVPFVTTQLHLGPMASEETARDRRYEWLRETKQQYDASAIMTAHHQDDVLETIFINLIRGTGWRGLSSLRSTAEISRPLLGWSKVDIASYALSHGLTWHDDSTNDSFNYLRNRVRHMIMPRLTFEQRKRLVALNESQLMLRQDIDNESGKLLRQYTHNNALDRYPLIMSSNEISREILRVWLGEALEIPRLNDLVLFTKVAKNGAKWPLDGDRFVCATKTRLIVQPSRD